MKNPILYLAIRTLLNKKSRTVFLIINIVICLSVMLVSTVTINSFQNTYANVIQNKNGVQHIILFNVKDNINHISSQKLKNILVGNVNIIGVYNIPNSATNQTISFGYMDNTAIYLSKVHLIKGTLPVNSGEAVIEKATCSYLNLDSKIGSFINLNIYQMDGKGGYLKTPVSKRLKLVGIIDNYTNYQCDKGIRKAGYIDLPSVILNSEDSIIKNAKHKTLCDYIYINDSKAPFASISNIINGNLKFEQISFNTHLYEQNGSRKSFPLNLQQIMIMLFLLGVTAFSLMCLLSTITVISKNSKEHICNLKLINTSNTELIRLSIYQYLLVILISTPLSLGTSYFVSKCISYFLNSVYLIEFDLSFSLIQTVIVLLVGSMTVVLLSLLPFFKIIKSTPIQILTDNYGKQYYKNAGIKTNKPMLLWSAKSILCNTREVSTISISFALCIAIFIAGVFTSRSVERIYSSDLNSDYVITSYDGMTSNSLRMPHNLETGINIKDISMLEKSVDVKSIFSTKYTPFNIIVKSNSDYTKFKHVMPENELSALDGMKNFQIEKSQYNYDNSDRFFESSIVSTDTATLSNIQKFLIDGHYNNKQLQSGHSVIYCTTDKNTLIKAGDTILFTQLIRNIKDNSSQRWPTAKKIEINAKVIAVALFQNNDNSNEKNAFCPYGLNFIWDDEALCNIGLNINYNNVFINLRSTYRNSDINEKLNTIKDSYSNVSIESKQAQEDLQRQLVTLTVIISNIMVALIALFGICNLAMYIYLKVKEKKHVYGTLKAIGVTDKQLYLLFNTESLLILFLACILGSILGIVLILAIASSGYFKWTDLIPWSCILITPFILLLLSLSVSIIPIRWIHKHSAVELIEYDT